MFVNVDPLINSWYIIPRKEVYRMFEDYKPESGAEVTP